MRKKTIKIADKVFNRISEAFLFAEKESRITHSIRYVIECADKYFVSTTCCVQPYETLHSTYENGRIQIKAEPVGA